ncbi:MAG: hypothetical protein JXL97_05520 [Bacteroidales bacterium]|nr:hypothetical protein [Bacteroidales bacterium]
MKRIEKNLFISKFFKNKKLILTILEEEASAGKIILKSILKYNHAKKIITLTREISQNLEILKNKIAKDWEMENEISNILEIIDLEKKHKKSSIEFMRRGSVIIMDENQNLEKINNEKLKKTFESIKKIKEIFHKKTIDSKNQIKP